MTRFRDTRPEPMDFDPKKQLPRLKGQRPILNRFPMRGHVTNRVWVCLKCRSPFGTFLQTGRGYIHAACQPHPKADALRPEPERAERIGVAA